MQHPIFEPPPGDAALWRYMDLPRFLVSSFPRPDGTQRELPRIELYVGRVRNIDFRTAEMPLGSGFWPVVHKRLPYAFEREVRLVMQPITLNEEVASVANREGRDLLTVVRDVAPAGYDVVVEPPELIQEVVVAPRAPDWLLDLIQNLTKRYGVDVPGGALQPRRRPGLTSVHSASAESPTRV